MPRSPIPRHAAVERHLRVRIAGLQPGDALESDAELCELFKVSRMTVRQATQRLVAEGAIYRVTGVGTFVGHPRVHREMGKLRSFTEEMQLRGRTVTSTVIEAAVLPGTKNDLAALRLPPRSRVVRIKRLRLADGEPLALETATLAPILDWAITVDFSRASLHEELARRGHLPTHAVGTQVAAPAGDEDARFLDIPAGSPLFVERRLVTDQDGVPIESTESRYAGSRFVFHIELNA